MQFRAISGYSKKKLRVGITGGFGGFMSLRRYRAVIPKRGFGKE